MLRPVRIGITSGDAHGIGPEVVAKALYKIGPQKESHFILWRSPDFPKRDLQRIKKRFNLKTVRTWAEALNRMPSSSKELLDICQPTNPAVWVEEAAAACFFKHIDALATAPLSKPTIKASGLKDIGHTDILKRVSQAKQAYMVFIGTKFHIMLATGHVPVLDISSRITAESLTRAVKAAHSLTKLFPKIGLKKFASRPVGVLSLNPHASDEGLIGFEEDSIIKPALTSLKASMPIEGPLVPDSAFTPTHWERYSLYLALYHDQGLIPFKTVHGQEGVHLTWGLPFVRTSVDHGTAFDIAGQDKADPTSMRRAIELAVKMGEISGKNGASIYDESGDFSRV